MRLRSRMGRVVLAAIAAVAGLFPGPSHVRAAPKSVVTGPAPGGHLPATPVSTGTAKNGAFQYSIPIDVPPGRAVAPSLHLRYSSDGAVHGGIASGWDIDVPAISRDTSRGILGEKPAWQNANGEPLVPVAPDSTTGPNVFAVYRAQGDREYGIYEQMNSSVSWLWQLRTPDGLTHRFGNRAYAAQLDSVAPVVATIDPFGNTVSYIYAELRFSGTPAVEYRLERIAYTSNAVAGIGAHAQVRLYYDRGPRFCGQSLVPIGASSNYRTGQLLYHGSHRLLQIETQVRDSATSKMRWVRRYTLDYAPAAERCDQPYAPQRRLQKVTVSARSRAGTITTKPPVEFTYGPLDPRERKHEVTTLVGFGPLSAGRDHANVELEPIPHRPPVDRMALDLDGDGRADLLSIDHDEDNEANCQFTWRRNQGDGFAFPQGLNLPQLPWADNAGRPNDMEYCSLSAQFTQYRNKPVHASGCLEDFWTRSGTFLNYRFQDMNNDGLVDLVAAMEHNRLWFDPNIDRVPAGTPGYVPLPLFPYSLDYDRPPTYGSIDFVQRMIELLDVDTDADDCRWQNWPHRNAQPHVRDSAFLWLVYENQGDGVFANFPSVLPMPVPLVSPSTYDYALLKGEHGVLVSAGGLPAVPSEDRPADPVVLMDINGDGFLDAVSSLKSAGELEGSDPPATHWEVLLGDGQGNFRGDGASPFRFPALASTNVGPGSWVSAVPSGGGSGPASPFGTDWSSFPVSILVELSRPLYSLGFTQNELLDLNGDGLREYFKHTSATYSAFFSDGRSFVQGVGSGRPITPEVDVWLSSSHSDYDHPFQFGPPRMGLTTQARETFWADYDHDGRPDLFEVIRDEWWGVPHETLRRTVRINAGDFLLNPIEVAGCFPSHAAETTDHRWYYPNPEATGPGEGSFSSRWKVTRELVDLDGDREAECVTLLEDDTLRIERPQRDYPAPRLLYRISTGTGASITIGYSTSADPTVVIDRGRTADKTWLVKSLTVAPGFGQPAGITRFQYEGAVYNHDVRGHYGFRGFARTATIAPAGAVSIESTGYDLDYRGLPSEVALFAAGDLASPGGMHSLTRTAWGALSLSGGQIQSFQPAQRTTWKCVDADGPTDCETSGKPLSEVFDWTAYPTSGSALLYATTRTTSFAGVPPLATHTPGPADHVDEVVHKLFVGVDRYHLREGTTSSFTLAGGRLSSRHESLFDPTGRVVLFARQLVDQDNGARWATTESIYNMGTGVRMALRRPRQYATNGPYRYYGHTPDQVFATTVKNELGHLVKSEYDYGTGELLVSLGPNQKACASCPGGVALEQLRRVIDGFGREIERWVSVDDPTVGYQLQLLARGTFVEANIGVGTPARLVEEARVDFNVPEMTRTESEFDGLGRTRRRTTFLFTGGANATETYGYDHAGNMVRQTVPNSATNDASTVDYTFEYDSLGRVISELRPDGTGVDTTYVDPLAPTDPLVSIRTEKVPGPLAGGPMARTLGRQDVFGRMVEVGERTGTGTTATTRYTYDINDDLAAITDAEGNVTQVDHDLAGNRRAIHRGARSWRFLYDLNNNLLTRTFPYPAGANPARYSVSTVWDDLDRPTSQLAGTRDLSADVVKNTLADEMATFRYDTQPNGVGRVSTVEWGVTRGAVYSMTRRQEFLYDAQGAITEEAWAFDLRPAGFPFRDKRITYRRHNAQGALTRATLADETSNGGPTTMELDYDRRGMVKQLRWLPASGPTRVLATVDRNVAGHATRNWNADYERHWQYDSLGRVTYDDATSTNGGWVHFEDVDYYGTGDIRSHVAYRRDLPMRTFNYTYDDRHQLTTAADGAGYAATFDYTTLGLVRTAKVSAPAGAPRAYPRKVAHKYDGIIDPHAVDRLVDGQGDYSRISYNEAGDVVGRWMREGDRKWVFDFDGYDRQRRTTAPDNTRELYYYDGDGTRWLTLALDAAGKPTGLKLAFDETEIWYGPEGAITRTLVRLGAGSAVAQIEDRFDLEYTFHNGLGHLLAAVQPSGNITAAFIYAPFGEVLARTGGDETHSRQFNGKEFDAASELIYYGFRYYDAVTMSWNQADPLYVTGPDRALGEPRRANLYTFSLNNPLRYVDPDGRDGFVTFDGVAVQTGWTGDRLYFVDFEVDGKRYRVTYAPEDVDLANANTNDWSIYSFGGVYVPTRITATSAPKVHGNLVNLDIQYEVRMLELQLQYEHHLQNAENLHEAAKGMLLGVQEGARMFCRGICDHLEGQGGTLEPPMRRMPRVGRAGPPNPWGRRGSPAHRERIAEAEQRLQKSGWKTVAGGDMAGSAERAYPVGGGKIRYPDLVMTRNGRTVAIEVGRRTSITRQPVWRERSKIRDLRNSGHFDHVFFLCYDCK